MLNFDNNKSQSYKTKICHINIINYLSFQIRWYVSTIFPGLKYDLNYLLQFKHDLGQTYSYRIDSWSDLMYPITLLINFLSTNNLFICLSSFHHFFHLFNNFLRVWHLKHDSSSFSKFFVCGWDRSCVCLLPLSYGAIPLIRDIQEGESKKCHAQWF